MKMLILSALCTGRIYSAENIPSNHFLQRPSRFYAQNAEGKIMSMKYSGCVEKSPEHPLLGMFNVVLIKVFAILR